MKIIKGSVCTPAGFLAGGIWCGIKASSRKRDLAMIYCKKPCTASAVFTSNKVKAACIHVSKKNISNGIIRAVIANSGNANACTGEEGFKAAQKMTELAADLFAINPNEVIVASTGVIGVPFPIEAVENSIEALGNSLLSDEAGSDAALEAIMTTDTRKKSCAAEIDIEGKIVRLGAMVKGSGMIHPNMATMLCFITTDAAIQKEALDKSLQKAVNLTFNRLTVDGDTSTNDMALIMANGEAGNTIIKSDSRAEEQFTMALTALCRELVTEMAKDGEGATKMFCVFITGCTDDQNAEIIAKAVASSSLVKAAIFGADANWGRIICAMGYSGADFIPEKTNISFKSGDDTVNVCKNGQAVSFSEADAKKILLKGEIEIIIEAGNGSGTAEAWGCDLTYDYVKINGDYRS